MSDYRELSDEELEKINGGVEVPANAYVNIKALAEGLRLKKSFGLIELCKQLLAVGISEDTICQIIDKNSDDLSFGEKLKKDIHII